MTLSYALVVPLALGEEARRAVRSSGIGRSDLKVGRREGHLLIPIARPIEPPWPGATVEVIEFSGMKPPKTYRDVVQVPERYRPLLPSSFDVVGDLVLIKPPPELKVFGPAIGEAILKVHKNVKAVLRDDGVSGPFRVRTLTPLAGEPRTRTTHKEYGALFNVDLAKAYFSPRLANEHDRVARLVGEDEVVVDATAGVGPFSIQIARARRSARIHAIDLNPEAVALLKSNLAENRVQDRVTVHEGDAKAVLPGLRGASRIIVNLPHGGEDILDVAASTVAAGGTLHYYRIVPEADRAKAGQEWADRLTHRTGRATDVANAHVVHAYSPSDRLVSVDFRVV